MVSAGHAFARFALTVALAAALLAVQAGTAQAKVSSSVSGSLLTVKAAREPDRITVTCTAGLVKVNRKDPRSGAIECSKVSEVDVMAGSGKRPGQPLRRRPRHGLRPSATCPAASVTAPAPRPTSATAMTASSEGPPPSTWSWPGAATTI